MKEYHTGFIPSGAYSAKKMKPERKLQRNDYGSAPDRGAGADDRGSRGDYGLLHSS